MLSHACHIHTYMHTHVHTVQVCVDTYIIIFQYNCILEIKDDFECLTLTWYRPGAFAFSRRRNFPMWQGSRISMLWSGVPTPTGLPPPLPPGQLLAGNRH